MRARILLIVLGAVAAGALTCAMWPAAGSVRQVTNRRRDTRKPHTTSAARWSQEMRLADLAQPPPAQRDATRNPFAFYVTPPSPPQLVARQPSAPWKPREQMRPRPAPPSIPIKFIGVLEQGTTKVAIFSDGEGPPVWASEGQNVMGQYKLLTIGVESVTMSYLDGSGMQTIPLRRPA